MPPTHAISSMQGVNLQTITKSQTKIKNYFPVFTTVFFIDKIKDPIPALYIRDNGNNFVGPDRCIRFHITMTPHNPQPQLICNLRAPSLRNVENHEGWVDPARLDDFVAYCRGIPVGNFPHMPTDAFYDWMDRLRTDKVARDYLGISEA